MWPEAVLVAPDGLRRKPPDLRVDSNFAHAGASLWPGEIDHVIVESAITIEAVVFHHGSRTVLVSDLIQHFDRGWFPGWRGIVARLDGLSGTAPDVPRKFRVALIGRRRASAALRRVADWPAGGS